MNGEDQKQTLRESTVLASGSTGVAAGFFSVLVAGCCVSPAIAPLIVGLLGASGVALGASLQPYAPVILGLSGTALAYGVWAHGRALRSCEARPMRRRAALSRLSGFVLHAGVVSWCVAVVVTLLLP